MICFRSPNPEEASDISLLLCRSITELCRDDHENNPQVLVDWLKNKTPNSIALCLENEDSVFVLGMWGDVLAGVGCYSKSGEILLNYVSPDLRFHGVSKALLSEMEKQICNSGIHTAFLMSTKTAYRFYLNRGWLYNDVSTRKSSSIGYPMRKKVGPGSL